jgi:hypothetical protein
MQYEYHDEIAPFTEDDWKRLMESMSRHGSALYGQWVTDNPDPLEEMAKEYVARCDAYDGDLHAAQMSPWQRSNSNRHAYQVRRELCSRWSVTERQFHEAIVAYQRNRR